MINDASKRYAEQWKWRKSLVEKCKLMVEQQGMLSEDKSSMQVQVQSQSETVVLDLGSVDSHDTFMVQTLQDKYQFSYDEAVSQCKRNKYVQLLDWREVYSKGIELIECRDEKVRR